MAKSKINPMDKFIEKNSEVKPAAFLTESFIKTEILILPELRDLIPALAEDESKQLEENLLSYGIKDPISVWETNAYNVLESLEDQSPSRELFGGFEDDSIVYILFDGHNRHRIALENGLDFKVNKMSFNTLSDVKDYMINYQLGRRNLTAEQVSYLRGLKYNELKKVSKGKSVKEKINVADSLAEEFGVSDRTIKRDGEFAEGMDKLGPDLKKDVLSGKTKMAKKDVHALKSTKTQAPINSMEEVLKLLQEEESNTNQKDTESHDIVDAMVDTIYDNYYPDTAESKDASVSEDEIETLDFNEFKEAPENEIEKENLVGEVSGELLDVNDIDAMENNLKELFKKQLSYQVLNDIIKIANELLEFKRN